MKNSKVQFVVAAVLLLASVAVWAAFVDGVETFDGSVKDTDTWEEWIMDGIYGSVTQNDSLTMESCSDYTTKTVTVGIGQAVSVEVHYANPPGVYGIANLVLTDNSEGTAMSTRSDANSLFISFDEHWGSISGGHSQPPYGWLNVGFFDAAPPSPNAVILELARLSSTNAQCSAYDLDWNLIGTFTMTTPVMPDELYISLHVCHVMPYTFDNVMLYDLPPLPPETVPVLVDIKPDSCYNRVNFKSNAMLPVAVLGSEIFDVSMIDPASIRLNDAAPVRSGYEDASCWYGGISYEARPVLDEVHVFNDPFTFMLDQEHADMDSIVMTDITGTLVYTREDDYEVFAIDGQVVIEPTTLGTEFPNISDGQTLLVDYVYYVEDKSACRGPCSDGFTDLVLRFKTRDVVETLPVEPQEPVMTLSLTGVLYDGTPIEGNDWIQVKGYPKKKTKPHKK